MIELNQTSLRFSFPEVHPDAVLDVTFHRTLRIPDDERDYPLPPSMGHFPMAHVDDYRDRVPPKWVEHGGIMLPMYQAEALWISFSARRCNERGVPYPFAVKVGTGKISAVTGDEWESGLREKDYLVTPPQPWLDGYASEEDVIRQFVAAPLGWGFSAEEQLTGKADHGGIQLEVFPMHREIFEKKFPKRAHSVLRGTMTMGFGGSETVGVYSMSLSDTAAPVACALAADMGLAPGGRMKQEIFEDPHGKDAWVLPQRSRCFVHLANSLAWRAITGKAPPETPVTAEEYTRHGYPWFDYYEDGAKALKGSGKLKGLKSVLEMGFQKGLNILPENIPVDVERVHVIKSSPGSVRVGNW
jgi:hypothetical protein